MPRTLKMSLWLLVVSVSAGILAVAVGATPSGTVPASYTWIVVLILLVAVIPSGALWIFVAYRAYRGRNWARWLLVIFLALGLLESLPSFISTFSVTASDFLELLAVLTQAVSVALLFTPTANAWYRRVTADASAT